MSEVWAIELAPVCRIDRSALKCTRLWMEGVEEALSLHPAVGECVVMEMPHLARGKDTCAFVTLLAALKRREQELREWVLSGTDGCIVIQRIVILHELPKGPTGDIDHSALKDLALSLETGIEVVT